MFCRVDPDPQVSFESSTLKIAFTVPVPIPELLMLKTSVADPNPDPDVFGPPGSGSFYHHAKIVRKTVFPTIF
jgi:hypothetical protein